MKREVINKYFTYISDKIDNINYDAIYDTIVNHDSEPVINYDKNDKSSYCDSINFSNKKKKANQNDILLTIIFNLKNYVEIVNGICKELNNKKIKYFATFKASVNLGYFTIALDNADNLLDVSDFINIKLSKILCDINPFFFNSNKIIYSFKETYSYSDILVKYLTNFSLIMKKNNKELCFDNFKDYMVDVYFKLEHQVDLYKFLKFNTEKISLNDFFINLEIITTVIMYLFNGNNYIEFIDYYNKINKKNSCLIKKYECYANFDDDKMLLENIVNELVKDHNKDEIIKSLASYKKTAKPDYITRKYDLRKKVMSSKTFLIYLNEINLKEEIEKLVPGAILKNKKEILENVCKDNYKSYNKKDNLGKVQVIRGLIRMEYGDYTAITRNNDARKIATDKINPKEIMDLIRFTLKSNSDEKENELYEKYADYIERLCN